MSPSHEQLQLLLTLSRMAVIFHPVNNRIDSLGLHDAGIFCTNLFSIYCSDFMKSAWTDIERFKEQKNHDLKEALISYAVMQISMCKKVSLLD